MLQNRSILGAITGEQSFTDTASWKLGNAPINHWKAPCFSQIKGYGWEQSCVQSEVIKTLLAICDFCSFFMWRKQRSNGEKMSRNSKIYSERNVRMFGSFGIKEKRNSQKHSRTTCSICLKNVLNFFMLCFFTIRGQKILCVLSFLTTKALWSFKWHANGDEQQLARFLTENFWTKSFWTNLTSMFDFT